MQNLKKILFLIYFFLITYQLHATHIVGGNIAVEWVSGNNFRVTLTFFKDCRIVSAPDTIIGFDAIIGCGVYDKVSNSLQQSFLMTLLSKDTLQLGDTCFTPPNLCVVRGIYSSIISIQDNPNGYYIAWQRCCRNHIIINIQNPGAAGMVFYSEIPNPVLHDNTPVFGSYPNAYFCINQVNNPSFACSDADGDSLVYSLITPLNGYTDTTNTGAYPPAVLDSGPYPPVVWETTYDITNMVGGNPPMTIDPHTGIITAQPSNLGIYVFAVRVEEYRNGVKIGEVRRDIQYQVLPCLTFTAPIFTSPVTTSITDVSSDTSYTIVAGDLLSIDLTVTSSNQNDSVFLYGSSELFSSPLPGMSYGFHNDSAQGTVQQNFILQTTCDAIRDAPYHLKFDGVKHTCYGLLKTTLDINVYVKSLTDGFVDSLVPNVFTPDNDGKNDSFHINTTPNYCFDRFKMKIYNRWGILMFETDDFLFQWDGTNKNNSKLSEGVYYYILDASFKQSSFTKRGFIHLLM
jgi:gliding motility-associated-like protein